MPPAKSKMSTTFDDSEEPLQGAPLHLQRRILVRVLRWTVLELVILAALFVVYELETSRIQARYFSPIAAEATYAVAKGRSAAIRFPEFGPYNERLGYVELPDYIAHLEGSGFEITDQASWSPRMLELDSRGVFAIYDEKQQAGLEVFDAGGSPIFETSVPRDVYASLDDVPGVIIDTLLFVENRSLLKPEPLTRNPAVEWKRLTWSVIENLLDEMGLDRGRPPGASTLATQLEKFRHSKGGRTQDVRDKLMQMVSATLRAYRHGPNTLAVRRNIALAYINGVPLAATPSTGEIYGLRDALRVWFGVDPQEVDRLLWTAEPGGTCEDADIEARALAYRQVVSLILAQRRPSELLVHNRGRLDDLTDSHLRVLRAAGIVPPELAEAALAARVPVVAEGAVPASVDFSAIKLESAVRTMLQTEVGAVSHNALVQLDASVQSTIEFDIERQIRDQLLSLADPEVVRSSGLVQRSLLKEGTAEGLVFSFTLYERTSHGSALRIQVDTHPQPLNINEGIKLDLGSTAKLRTLATYLHSIGDLYDLLASRTPAELGAFEVDEHDSLTLWVVTELRRDPSLSLETLLEEAMLRTYSASPGEAFYTGGGVHYFGNFDDKDNGRRVTVREAFQRSINLPFVRIMRDIVRYYVPRVAGAGPTIFSDVEHPGRKPRLDAFVQSESREYLEGFRNRYEGMSHADAVTTLVRSRTQWWPLQLGVALRSVAPDMTFEVFAETLREKSNSKVTDEAIRKLYDDHGPGKFDWKDRGYLARVHPLELWYIDYLRAHPEPTWEDVVLASADVRLEVYTWLFKPKRKRQQDTRIRIVLEREAFQGIHAHWQELGYPFDSVVPSLATAIGAAADRPDSLAQLVGLIANGGVAQPRYVASSFHFAQGTPFETRLMRAESKGQRVMKAEAAERIEAELRGVVSAGTARRLSRAEPFKSDPLWAVGGKTGTGDHRRKTMDRRGNVLSETPISRSATFAFFLGDRFHGTMTVYVAGAVSEEYSFTSSLPVTLLAQIAPLLEPIVGRTTVEAVEEPAPVAARPKKASPAKKAPVVRILDDDVPLIDKRIELLDYEDFIEMDSL